MSDVALMDFTVLRERSLVRAKQLGYPTNPSLPLLDETLMPRPQDEIEMRALSLHCVVAASCGFPAARALEWLLREGLVDSLTPRERDFLQGRDLNNVVFQSQVEALWLFAWVFSKFDDLNFAQPCQDNLVTLYPNLHKAESSEDWRRANRLRGPMQILEVCDLAYCLHWAINQAMLEREKLPGRLNSLVIIERRRALEWILSRDDWDAVPLDT